MRAPVRGDAVVSGWRAAARLARMLAHVVTGIVTMAWRFGRIDAAARQAHIQAWSADLLGMLGIRLTVRAQIRPAATLLVANHVSWLDIAVIHAVAPQARFVSKADVARWPLVGWMVRKAGTLFIERGRKRDAMRVVHQVADALQNGDTVAFFPEGTTGTGPTLLPFHANLLQAAIACELPVQPLVLRYHRQGQRFAAAAEYVGDTSLLASAWRMACCADLCVDLEPLPAVGARHADRRALASHLRQQMQSALDAR